MARNRSLILLASVAFVLQAEDYGKLKVEALANGFKGTEGPVWSRQGYLLFSDFDTNVIHRYDPGKGVSAWRTDSNGANGNTMDRQGRLYTCEYRTRRVTRTSKDGKKIEVLAEKWEGKRFNAPNDIIVRRDGHVYFTDPLYTPLEHRDLDFYGIYHITPKGQLDLIARWKTRPNGIALSPDGSILYVVNSEERNIRAFDVDKKGKASNERTAVPKLVGGVDGIRVDAKGNIFAASRNVDVYTPKGEHAGSIPLPQNCRNLAFGDADFKTLYITGRDTLFRVRLETPGAIHY